MAAIMALAMAIMNGYMANNGYNGYNGDNGYNGYNGYNG